MQYFRQECKLTQVVVVYNHGSMTYQRKAGPQDLSLSMVKISIPKVYMSPFSWIILATLSRIDHLQSHASIDTVYQSSLMKGVFFWLCNSERETSL